MRRNTPIRRIHELADVAVGVVEIQETSAFCVPHQQTADAARTLQTAGQVEASDVILRCIPGIRCGGFPNQVPVIIHETAAAVKGLGVCIVTVDLFADSAVCVVVDEFRLFQAGSCVQWCDCNQAVVGVVGECLGPARKDLADQTSQIIIAMIHRAPRLVGTDVQHTKERVGLGDRAVVGAADLCELVVGSVVVLRRIAVVIATVAEGF